MDYVKELEAVLGAVINKLKEDLRGVRSNRPSIEVLEEVKVSYYNDTMPLKQLGTLSLGSQREIMITVWDKNAVGAVSNAIEAAKLGFSVSTQGENMIRATLPALTNERRDELSKLVKRMVEDARVQVRSRRDEFNKKVKAAEDDLGEDQAFKIKENLQKTVDKANADIEQAMQTKFREIES